MKRIAIVLVSALLLVACSTKDNTEPPAPLVTFNPKVEVQRVWDVGIGDGTDEMLIGLVPSVQGGQVFTVGGEGLVSAWDVQTGDLVWETETDYHAGGGPGVGDNVLAFGTTEGDVVALGVDKGRVLWTEHVKGAVITAPAVGHGVVVVRTQNGKLIGMSARDGHQLWSLSRDVPQLSLRGNATPVIKHDTVYAGFDDGTLLAVGLKTGKVKWKATIAEPKIGNELEQMVDLDGRPVVHFGFVYAVTFHGKLTSLIASSGEPLWSIPMSSYTGVSYGNSHVYVTDEDSVVHAVGAISGDKVWKQAAMRARSLTRPTPFHGTVAMGDFAGYVHFLSQKTGEYVARVKATSERITAAPVVAGNTLIVLGEGGELVAYRFPAASND